MTLRVEQISIRFYDTDSGGGYITSVMTFDAGADQDDPRLRALLDWMAERARAAVHAAGVANVGYF